MYKRCPVCKKDFETLFDSRKYCGLDCRKEFQKQQIYGKNKTKLCKKCKHKKILRNRWYCGKCIKIVLKEQNEQQKGLARNNSKLFYERNKNSSSFKYKRNERYKAYHKKRRWEDPQFETAVRLRSLLYCTLKKYTKRGKAFSSKKYGIDFDKIIQHLKPFPKNLGEWHIDHIRPLSSFNLEDSEEIKKAFAPENHQWLLALDNIRKSNK